MDRGKRGREIPCFTIARQGRISGKGHTNSLGGLPVIRCAAYARYSTDKQNPLSTEDQLRKCKEYAESRGWRLLETQIFKDEEISGATLRRPGLEALLSVAESPVRPFDVVIFEDTSRLSRKQADVLNLCERLIFAGVRVCFVTQGVDSEDKTFQLLLMARGMIDQLFLSDTASRVC
jgi:DNA invertase Pin-like site-specific DNA recombinase